MTKKNTVFLTILLFFATAANAIAEELKLHVPEMKPELVQTGSLEQSPSFYFAPCSSSLESPSSNLAPHSSTFDFDFFKQKTNPGVKAYKVLDDLTFVGIPLFVAGITIKGDKASFRQDYNNTHANTRLLTNFKTGIDDYTQFFGPVATVGLKLAGLESRSDWPRLMASSLMSYGIMAALVNGIKYTASEMRPDGSSANSWPSGHTATSFVGATILHKEYGLTRSPWFSVAGYGVATATGVMRILNNRHWISDVLSGAGIGIMSTELGYALGDIFFKQKGLLRNDLQLTGEDPSFFSISIGTGLGLRELNFDYHDISNWDTEYMEDAPSFDVDFHTGTAVDAEGAYFFNKYIGVGGRLRVRAMTAKSWKDFVSMGEEDRKELGTAIIETISENSSLGKTDITKEMGDISTDEEYSIESDHLTEFSANLGIYFNYPLSSRFSLGSKLLIGRTLTQELDINARYKGHQKDVNYVMTIEDGIPTDLEITRFASNGVIYDEEWDYLTLGGNNSTTFGTGLSLTYRYKSNFAWRLFVDYDYSEKIFKLAYDPLHFLKIATPSLASLYDNFGMQLNPVNYEKKKDVHYITIGASFAVTF